MAIFLKRLILFLLIALVIAFLLIPIYEVFVGGVPFEYMKQRIIDNIQFVSFDIWKQVFIFYLALWCGKAILWALATGETVK